MDKFIVKSNARDIAELAKAVPVRAAKLKSGSAEPLPKTYAVNETAKALHPAEQRMIVKSVEVFDDNVKSYVLVPEAGGTPAYFRAGQYVGVKLKIGSSVLSRPYSLASSPADSLRGEYKITVKRIQGGFASDYILDNWSVGDSVTLSAPDGTFFYEGLRDAGTVVALAGGSGITPFLSMAAAIADGTQDSDMVLLYGCRNENEILFKDKFDALCAGCDRIKVIYVLSDSDTGGYEHGFITAELIKKYVPESYSVFVCGPTAMYSFVSKEIEKLGLERKYIRFELQSGAKPDVGEGKTFTCKVVLRGSGRVIDCRSDESILVALERAGISAPSMCRAGECGFCRSKLISGEVFIPKESDGRRVADLEYGYIHPCCTFPKGDIEVGIMN